MSQFKNPTLEWLSAAVSVREEDVWCNIFTSRKQQISIHNTAALLHTVSVILSSAGVSVAQVSPSPHCPHPHTCQHFIHCVSVICPESCIYVAVHSTPIYPPSLLTAIFYCVCTYTADICVDILDKI